MSLQKWTDTYKAKKDLFESLKTKVDQHHGYRESLTRLLSSATERSKEIDKQIDFNQKIVQLFQVVSDHSQSQITKIEEICSDALREILADPNIQFKIRTEKKRNAVETVFYINDSTVGDVNLMKGEAGAVKNIISVGLRLIFLELYNPKLEGPVILDEIGGNISVEYQQSFGKFLKKFSDLTGRQIILVSHHQPVREEATKRIVLSKQGNRSTADE